ncbi:hypothetical protein [Parapedobacter indicus]|uniref:Tetratricopeptide repeat-containing protein n=1 Tax=Parapedobacter indicus TaxID=1477437 RepID=A0A1I3FIK8_9SPHI|nr:hypothetical protein [Parapedobacter indicus]PPL03743.1 hypothetical protein CLV26_102351 [Parapedobacter indicus]SFI11045.1 hypothetical protein SAMN05444682_102351 [Parapedobacter indicus]
MRKVITFFIITTISWLGTYAQDLESIRLLYKDATKSKEQAEAFYEPVKEVTQADQPVLVAYKGAGLMLLARYEKLANRGPSVKEAAQWIEQAVSADPENAEIRLIRLSVQEHLPRFLKYNQHIDEDRQFIQQALPSLKDESLTAMINGYFEEFSTK